MTRDRKSIAFLSTLIFLAIFANNAEFVFRTEVYEQFDTAANSLRVLRAKRFEETLGNYSRFGFHHPGPAFFYVYALGESLFYDWFPIVPTPFNAQKIPLFALASLFLGSAIALAAGHLDPRVRRHFVPLALLFGAIHFAFVGRSYAFIPVDNGLLSSWPPCAVVAPFLGFLVAGASVAAGKGHDLPWLVLAACFLVHGHVAMPLFVVPLTALAYALLARRVREQTAVWPWQDFARQHWIGGSIITLFLLPIAINAVGESPNNLALIANHLQVHGGARKPLLDSVLYFLQFAAYTPSGLPGRIPQFDAEQAVEITHFFRAHAPSYTAWLLTGVIALLPVCWPRDTDGSATSASARRFLKSLVLLVGAATVLSLVWGRIQTAEMYYFNAFFNFAIYYAVALIAAARLALWMAAQSRRLPDRLHHWNIRFAPLAISAAAAAAFISHSDGWRPKPVDSEAQRTFIHSVKEALADDPAPGTEKILIFDSESGFHLLGVALQLERHRRKFKVASDMPPVADVVFGRERVVGPDFAHLHTPAGFVWRAVKEGNLATNAADTGSRVRPLLEGYMLATPAR